jgi:hypothetical protein
MLSMAFYLRSRHTKLAFGLTCLQVSTNTSNRRRGQPGNRANGSAPNLSRSFGVSSPKTPPASVNIGQQSSNLCVKLALERHAMDPRLPGFPACALQ